MTIIYGLMLRVSVSLGHSCRLLPQSCWNWCLGNMRFLCVSLNVFTNICQTRSPYILDSFFFLPLRNTEGVVYGIWYIQYMVLAQDMEGCTLWHEPPGWGVTGMAFPRAIKWDSPQPPLQVPLCFSSMSSLVAWCHLKPCLPATSRRAQTIPAAPARHYNVHCHTPRERGFVLGAVLGQSCLELLG